MRFIHRIRHWFMLQSCVLTHVRGIGGHLFITTKCTFCGEVDESDMTHSTACECDSLPEGAEVPQHLRANDPIIRRMR